MLTIGKTLQMLRSMHEVNGDRLYRALKVSSSTYLKIERDQRDLSFLMAVRLCHFYRISLEGFVNLIDPEELDRMDLSSIKALKKVENRKG